MHHTAPQHFRLTSGFSLLEVLVALAIIAIAFGATLRVIHDRTNTVEAVRFRILARWVAQNKIAELQLTPNPNAGTTSGETKQYGLLFYWTAQIDALSMTTKNISATVTVSHDQRNQDAIQQTWITPPLQPAPLTQLTQ